MDEYKGRPDSKFIRIQKENDDTARMRGWKDLADMSKELGEDLKGQWFFDEIVDCQAPGTGDEFKVKIFQTIHNRLYADTVQVRKVSDDFIMIFEGLEKPVKSEGMIVEIMSDWIAN